MDIFYLLAYLVVLGVLCEIYGKLSKILNKIIEIENRLIRHIVFSNGQITELSLTQQLPIKRHRYTDGPMIDMTGEDDVE